LERVGDRLVVDVREVHDLPDPESPELEVSAKQVLPQVGAEVPDVGEVVDGGTAGVEADFAVMQRLEVLDLPGQGVVEAQSHGPLGAGRRSSLSPRVGGCQRTGAKP